MCSNRWKANSKIGQVTFVLMLFDGRVSREKKKKKKKRKWKGKSGSSQMGKIVCYFRNFGSLRYNCQDPSIGFQTLPGGRGPRPSVAFNRIRVCGTIYSGDILRQPAGEWSLKEKKSGADWGKNSSLLSSRSLIKLIRPLLRKCVDSIVVRRELIKRANTRCWLIMIKFK